MRFLSKGVQKKLWTVTLMSLLCWAICGLPAKADSLALTDIVRRTMAIYFGENPRNSIVGKPDSYQAFIRGLPVSANHAKPAGLFVTLSRDGKSRACWGSVHPLHKNQVEATVYATLGALTKEYRYKPITQAEWRTLKPQVTVIKALESIEGIRGINPLRDGLMVRAGGKSGVMLPGEARDAVYELVQCKLKAGIKPGESYQMYRIIADVYQ